MQKRTEELFDEFHSNLNGLQPLDIEKNRKQYGENVIREKKKTNFFVKFLKSFKDSLILILMLAAIISVILDPNAYVDSIIILVVVFFNSILGVIQETEAEKSLEALKKMSSPTSKVIRGGNLQIIPSKDIVVGDILVVEAGDHISADARLIECNNLAVDEASLTGESIPVHKDKKYVSSDNLALGDQKNKIFSSTYVTYGKGKAIVTEVGMHTEMGHIAGLLNAQEDATTPLQHKLSAVGKVIGLMALVICAIVFILEMIEQIKLGADLSKAWVDCFKTAIALAVAAIPEGLATVVTIVLAIGVGKMSKRNAIVKRLPAVETLGSCNVICSDKTGTLTQNKMSVQKIFVKDKKSLTQRREEEQKLLSYFAICSNASMKGQAIGDPTELALVEANTSYGISVIDTQRGIEIPYDSSRKRMTVVIKQNDSYLAITKGAIDKIIERSNVTELERKKIIEANDFLANQALRVLALGIQRYQRKPVISELEKNLSFVGLVGMIDPARPDVKEAIATAKKAGITTVMVTGDHLLTAKAIAKELGILEYDKQALTAQELDKMSDSELQNSIENYRVFARVAPKDKVRIVEAWQKRDAIVAMTGDGVNDAPALKKADIGCAMGITGTDVSKEAADMILVDDNFNTIVSAVQQGRGIYDNIKKCVKYLLSSNIGEVITIFLASLISALTNISMGVPLLPIHLLWINLITDSLPAFGIGMEEVEDSIMQEPPRSKKEGFFANHMTFKIIIEGVIIGVCALIAYSIGHFLEHSHILGQTMAFFTLSTAQLLHAYNVKSKYSIFSIKSYKNHFLNFAILIGFVLQFVVVYCPGVYTLFKFTPLSFTNLVICLGLSLLIVVYSELFKKE